MQERMNMMTPGIVGRPTPKKPKRNTQANMDISITTLMPYRLRKKGIIRMHSASLICEMEVSRVALSAANDSAIAGSELALKLVRNGPAKPLVTCRHMPSKAENMKKRAI